MDISVGGGDLLEITNHSEDFLDGEEFGQPDCLTGFKMRRLFWPEFGEDG